MSNEILPEQLARERLEAKQEALDDVEMLIESYREALARQGPEPTPPVAALCIEGCLVIVQNVRRELPRRPRKLE